MNSYTKVDGAWCVQVSGTAVPGETVNVTKRDGTVAAVRLGAFVKYGYNGAKIYAIVPEERAPRAPQGERQRYRIGELGNLLALFDRASQHLKFPGVVLKVHDTEYTIRVRRAGADSAAPGTLNVTDAVRSYWNSRYARNQFKWYGRVHRNGEFEMAQDTPLVIANRLKELAADPVRVASEHGRLTGRCCFCNLPLEDERSTAQGYGPVCAGHYGLPWGDRPAEFAAPAATNRTAEAMRDNPPPPWRE